MKTIDEAREELIHFIENVSANSCGGWSDLIDDLIVAVRNESHDLDAPHLLPEDFAV